MKVNKFVIYKNEIRLGRVEFHRELLPDGYNRVDVYGGGIFIIDTETKTVYLSGSSMDFGHFDRSKIEGATITNPHLQGYKIQCQDF